MTEQSAIRRCEKCGGEVECCEFCQELSCQAVTCYDCVNVALGQAEPQPHDHGG